MPKIQGSTMAFSGGAEETPIVKVSRFRAPGSLNDGRPTLIIIQNNHATQLSPETMRAILKWYESES